MSQWVGYEKPIEKERGDNVKTNKLKHTVVLKEKI